MTEDEIVGGGHHQLDGREFEQALGCSDGELSEAGRALHARPRSKPLSFRFLGTPQRCRLGWACVLCPFQV